MTRKFTGWHMTGIMVLFFGTVMAVNFTMAYRATSTFGGVVVQNSYVASQNFNGWLDDAEAQERLGWEAVASLRDDGRVEVRFTGPSDAAGLIAMARHPLGHAEPQYLAFDALGGGEYLSREALDEGRWLVRMQLTDGANIWRREVEL